jgi:DNA-binding beta-propeller fold protein YncE
MKTPSTTNSVSRSPLRYGLFRLLYAVAGLAAVLAPMTARGQLFATVNGKTTFYENGNGSIRIYDPVGNYTAFVDSFNKPRGIVFDSDGNLFVASNTSDELNNFNGAIFKITPDGTVSDPPFATGFPIRWRFSTMMAADWWM